MTAMQATFSLYKSRGQWRWRVTARNGKKIAVSSESYNRKRDAMRGAELAMQALVLALSERET